MTTVILLGYGNVGQQIYRVMQASKSISIVQVYNRSHIETLSTAQTQNISELKKADVYIIAVPDDAIQSLSEQLTVSNSLVVHTSGGVAMGVLSSNNRKGVFYPLQTFSETREVDFKKVPICIEATTKTDIALLQKLGEALSKNVVEISSEKRSALHLAAVFVNNFTNHLYAMASEISEAKNIDFSLLKPLIEETAAKIETLAPKEAQTGPALRNDTSTIKSHLKLLKDLNQKELYKQLTNSIKKYHNTKT